MTADQIANNLKAAADEKKNIAELEATLKKTTDPQVKQVLKHRIKICKNFQRQYMLNAQAGQRYLDNVA